MRGDVIDLVRELEGSDRPLSRRQFRLGLQLGGRRRPAREAPDPARSRLAHVRVERGRRARVRRLVRGGRHRDDAGHQSRLARARSRRATSSNTSTARPAATGATCARRTAAPSRSASSTGASATRWTGRGRSATRPPHEYGRLANEVAKTLRAFDQSLELIVCGSSNSDMKTYPEWERIVLEHSYDAVDHISLHMYFANRGQERRRISRAQRQARRLHRARSPRRSSSSAPTSAAASG